MFKDAPSLFTERLVIRRISMRDWEAYASAWADPELTRFIGGQPRSRFESWTRFLQSAGLWSVLGYGYWTFADRGTEAFIGCGGLARFERGMAALEGFPEAGWAFAPAAWGRGLATEAMGAVLDWSDRELDAPEIRCIIDPANAASRRVGEKLGFEAFEPVDNVVVYRRARKGGEL